MDAALSLLGLCVLAAMALVVPRSLKAMRQGDEQWRAQWRSLERDRRRSLLRTMRRGEPVRESENANLAMRAVAQVDHVRRAMRPLHLVTTTTLLALLIIGVAGGWTPLAIIAAAGLAAGAIAGLIAWERQRRLHESADRTRDLHSIGAGGSPGPGAEAS